MAQIINIAGTTPVDDPEYRYKMVRLVGKVEGRGNGIKTAIPNMVDVAASLHRPPGEVTKFFGCELGAQTTYVGETERAIVNGAHDTRVLQDKLSIYIEKFVLCPQCKLPESSYKIKHEIIYHNCAACGNREAVDMTHKLTTYILKQHKQDKKDKDKKDKKDKKEKKSDKKDKGDDDDEKRKEKKEKKKEKKEKKKEKKAKDDAEDDEAAEDGGDDASASDDEDEVESGPLGSAIRGIRAFVTGGKPANETVSELRAVQTFCALPRNERGFILCCAAFDGDLLKQLPEQAPLLTAFAKDATPYSLIGGLEKFCLVKEPQLAPKFALILKALYDADVLEEEDVLAWHGAGATGFEPDVHVPKACDPTSRATLLAAAEPFVKWLEEADEDDTEEE
mmetsp:Transcript_23805/g.73495  ORF Transcript_23805/g.73495 Transcript_23805/m.73495 type:complete len:393 (-) Transcript_23805:88-1266(-)